MLEKGKDRYHVQKSESNAEHVAQTKGDISASFPPPPIKFRKDLGSTDYPSGLQTNNKKGQSNNEIEEDRTLQLSPLPSTYGNPENIEQKERKQLERFANGQISNISSLAIKYQSFVKWVYGQTGQDTIAKVKFLKNKGYSINSWPNISFPYEVTISNSATNISCSWITLGSKVNKMVKAIEPKAGSPRLFAWHAAKNDIYDVMPAEMKNLVGRYGGFNKPFIHDEHVLPSSIPNPHKINWFNLSNAMRSAWRKAISSGGSENSQMSVFHKEAKNLHLGILQGFKYINHKMAMSDHLYKKPAHELKLMATNPSSAMYSYRKKVNLSLLEKFLIGATKKSLFSPGGSASGRLKDTLWRGTALGALINRFKRSNLS